MNDWKYQEVLDNLNKRIELEALICEREGVIAENEYRKSLGQEPAYILGSFLELADRMRELVEEGPNG